MGMGKVIRSKLNKALKKIAAQKNTNVQEMLSGNNTVANGVNSSGDIQQATADHSDPMRGLLGDYQQLDEDVFENFKKRKNF